MGLGLRKPKSEKDLKGNKLRKQPRASEDSSTTSSKHQRIPSIAPVLPLPSHIARSALPASTSEPTHLQPPAGSTARPKSANHHHRRSRSFSALTSLISPTLSSFSDQPWRSRDAWLAIHARPASPPPASAIPCARDCPDGGWRRKGNGGFFARELAGVGESALPLPFAPTRPGAGRSQTMGDLAGELERPEIRRLASELALEEVQPDRIGMERPDQVSELNDWQPGFATSLYRKKTLGVPDTELPPAGPLTSTLPTSPEPGEEAIITPPPPAPAPSRPESHILPDSPPPPPAYRQPRNSTTNTSPSPAVRTVSTGSISDRTSQSSSIHTYESTEHLYHNLDTGEVTVYPPTPVVRSPESSPSEAGKTHRCSSRTSRTSQLTSRSSGVLDELPTRTSSLFHRNSDIPTIVTPTSTYYHFSSARSSSEEPQRVDFSARRGSAQPPPITIEEEYQHFHPPYPQNGQLRSLQHRQHPLSKLPHQQHLRDESLPALLPPAIIPMREVRSNPQIGGERMKGIPWAKAQQREGLAAGAERQGSGGMLSPSRQRVMDRVREMDQGSLAGPDQRPSGRAAARLSRRGSDVRETVRGGWV